MKITQLQLALFAFWFSVLTVTIKGQEADKMVKTDSIVTQMVKVDSTVTQKNPVNNTKQPKLRSWSVQAFIGQPLVYGSFLESDFVTDIGKTYDIQLGVTKNINHAIGIQLLGSYGVTKQYSPGSFQNTYAITNYHSLALMGDVNLSALGRKASLVKADYYKWALHAYGGIGTLGYNHDDSNRGTVSNNPSFNGPVDDAKMFKRSYFGQAAIGVRRRINQSFDAELKQTFVMSGDVSFDGT
ncbi:MAG: hypothetical protein ACEQSF_04015, partial [Solirubrobacteraceae bacterium]